MNKNQVKQYTDDQLAFATKDLNEVIKINQGIEGVRSVQEDANLNRYNTDLILCLDEMIARIKKALPSKRMASV